MVDCPRCVKPMTKTHEELWCPECHTSYRLTVDLGELASEIAIAVHQRPHFYELTKKTDSELLEHALSQLYVLITPDHNDILEALMILEGRLKK